MLRAERWLLPRWSTWFPEFLTFRPWEGTKMGNPGNESFTNPFRIRPMVFFLWSSRYSWQLVLSSLRPMITQEAIRAVLIFEKPRGWGWRKILKRHLSTKLVGESSRGVSAARWNVRKAQWKWHPMKIVHLTMEQFQNKNTSAQSLLGEHGPLIRLLGYAPLEHKPNSVAYYA